MVIREVLGIGTKLLEVANPTSRGQMFAQGRCLPDHCELLDASAAPSTLQGKCTQVSVPYSEGKKFL